MSSLMRINIQAKYNMISWAYAFTLNPNFLISHSTSLYFVVQRLLQQRPIMSSTLLSGPHDLPSLVSPRLVCHIGPFSLLSTVSYVSSSSQQQAPQCRYLPPTTRKSMWLLTKLLQYASGTLLLTHFMALLI